MKATTFAIPDVKFEEFPNPPCPKWLSRELKDKHSTLMASVDAARKSRATFVAQLDQLRTAMKDIATADFEQLAGFSRHRIAALQDELRTREYADEFRRSVEEESKAEDQRRYAALQAAKEEAAGRLLKAGFPVYDLKKNPLRINDHIIGECDCVKAAFEAIDQLKHDRFQIDSASHINTVYTQRVRETLQAARTETLRASVLGG